MTQPKNVILTKSQTFPGKTNVQFKTYTGTWESCLMNEGETIREAITRMANSETQITICCDRPNEVPFETKNRILTFVSTLP